MVADVLAQPSVPGRVWPRAVFGYQGGAGAAGGRAATASTCKRRGQLGL